jgi:hypothetical protein
MVGGLVQIGRAVADQDADRDREQDRHRNHTGVIQNQGTALIVKDVHDCSARLRCFFNVFSLLRRFDKMSNKNAKFFVIANF